MSLNETPLLPPPDPSPFATTHWSVVLAARQGESAQALDALDRMCRAYWFPLYAFVRRRGYTPHDAQDLTQEFFARLVSKDFLRGVDRTKGKFRSFLLAALEHFLAKEWRRARAQKRGGGFSFVSIDAGAAEEQYLQVPAANLPPDRLFEQQWAMTLLNRAVTRLQTEFVESGKGVLFEKIKVFLTGEKRSVTSAELGRELGMSEAALKMAVSRLRRRYGELLRLEIADTVSTPEELEEELRSLLAAVG